VSESASARTHSVRNAADLYRMKRELKND
jgi:hypothetical protein